MTRPTTMNQELRTLKKHPVRTIFIYAVLLSWIAVFLWIRVSGFEGAGLALFGTDHPSLVQQVLIFALMIYPVVALIAWVLFKVLILGRRSPPPAARSEFSARSFERNESVRLDDPGHTIIAEPTQPRSWGDGEVIR